MSGELRLDSAGLREHGARLAEVADRMRQTHTGLQACLEPAEGSWGDDHMGRAFAEQFTPHADQVVKTVQAMAEHLHSTASGTMSAANEFDDQDADNAARVAAADLDRGSQSEDLAAPRSDGTAAGPVYPADTGRPGTPDPAGVPLARNSAEYPVGVEQGPPGGVHRPGGTPTPDVSPGRAVPDDSRRAQAPWSRSRPDSAPAANGAADTAGGRSPSSASAPSSAVSPPPSSSVSPAPARPNAPRGPETPTGNRAAAAPGPRRDTPWTEQPARTPAPTQAPGSPGRPGTPGGTGAPGSAGSSENSPASPRPGSPPRPNAPAGDKRGESDRPARHGRTAPDPDIARLARELADRHEVRVTGFDTTGLRLPAVQAFLSAVDRVLTGYPMITLEIVAVAELDSEPEMVRWSCEPREGRGDTRSITLDRRAAQRPEAPTDTVESAGPGAPHIYPATLRAFGRAFDAAGRGVARRQAQRVLIAEYLRTRQQPHPTLAEAVRGYRLWRAELAGHATMPGTFDLDEALGVAFAEVVQHGAAAGIQAQLLYAVLVAAAAPSE